MQVLKLALVSIVVACFSPLPATAMGDRPYNAAWFCNSMPDRSPIYVSAVWEKLEIQDSITQEFRKFIEGKYGYKGIVMCGGASSTQNANALAVEETTKAQQVAVWQKAGMKIVETGWHSNLPKVCPPPVNWTACAATILAPGGRPNQGPFETYVSAPFDSGDSTVAVQQAAFAQFLRSKYAITTTDLNPQCLALGDEEQALRAISQWTKNGDAGGRTIDTGWKISR